MFLPKLRDLREDHDLAQKEIAALLDITQQQYSLYESGQREIKLAHLITLCEHYHVSADYILGLPKGLPYGHSKTGEKG